MATTDWNQYKGGKQAYDQWYNNVGEGQQQEMADAGYADDYEGYYLAGAQKIQPPPAGQPGTPPAGQPPAQPGAPAPPAQPPPPMAGMPGVPTAPTPEPPPAYTPGIGGGPAQNQPGGGPGMGAGGPAVGGNMGGPADDPRWTNGTWGGDRYAREGEIGHAAIINGRDAWGRPVPGYGTPNGQPGGGGLDWAGGSATFDETTGNYRLGGRGSYTPGTDWGGRPLPGHGGPGMGAAVMPKGYQDKVQFDQPARGGAAEQERLREMARVGSSDRVYTGGSPIRESADNRQPLPTPTKTLEGSEIFNTLMDRARQGTNVSAMDPAVKGQTDAFRNEQTRATRNFTSDLAEKAGPGGPSGAVQGQNRMMAERAGRATGGFQAELMGRELQNKRSEIQQALGQAGGMLSQDQQAALQKELATMDNLIKQQDLDVRKNLGAGDLALRGELGRGDLGARWGQLDLQRELGYKDLDSDLLKTMLGHQQFGADLGLRRELGLGGLGLEDKRMGLDNDKFMADLGFRKSDKERYYDLIQRGLIK